MDFASPQPNSLPLAPPAKARLAADFETEAMPYMNDLYRTANRMLDHQQKAINAVKETYRRAGNSVHRNQRGCDTRLWLFQVLFRVVREEQRQWFAWLSTRDGHEPTDNPILKAMDRLPQPLREVLLLVDAQEFSYRETSTILQIPIETVMAHVSVARTSLHNSL